MRAANHDGETWDFGRSVLPGKIAPESITPAWPATCRAQFTRSPRYRSSGAKLSLSGLDIHAGAPVVPTAWMEYARRRASHPDRVDDLSLGVLQEYLTENLNGFRVMPSSYPLNVGSLLKQTIRR